MRETARAECRSERMRGGKFVILVYLASDDSESSQRIGMLDNRLKKKRKKNPWEQGAGRRVMMITQPQKIPGYHAGFLCWETQRQRHSDVGEETKEKVQQKCGGAECGVR